MKTNIKAKTANRAIVTVDGSAVAALQNVSFDDDYAPDQLSGIGDIHIQENVPTVARHTVHASEMVTSGPKMRGLGVAIENGDAALKGLVFDIMVMGKDDGALGRKFTGCSFASGSSRVEKHRIITTDATFNCLDASGTGI